MTTAEQTYDRMEREWLASRAVGSCEDCAMFTGVEAGLEEADHVMTIVSHMCRKRQDVELEWSTVLAYVKNSVLMAIESRGYCHEYGTMVCGAHEAAECDGWVPLEGVAR